MDKQEHLLGRLGSLRIERSAMPWTTDSPWHASAFGVYIGRYETANAAYRAALARAAELLNEAREELACMPVALD